MRKIKYALSVTLFLLTVFAIHPEELRLVTLQYPPYEFECNKNIEGVAVEIVKEVFRRMGVDIKIELLPWSRAIKQVEEGTADGIFTLYKTPEREAFVYYSDEVLMPQSVSLFVLKDSDISFDGDLQKLSKYKFGVVRGVSYGEKFDLALQVGIINNVEEVSVGEQNFMKLAAARIDIVVSNKYGAIDIINKIGKAQDIRELLPEIESLPSYIAFSKKNELLKVKNDFDRILRSMKKDGSYEQIIDDYFKVIE